MSEEQKCLTCMDLVAAQRQIFARTGVYRCVECENVYCRDHAVMHFTAGTRKRPLQCETLEISDAALEMVSVERDALRTENAQLRAQVASLTAERDDARDQRNKLQAQVAQLQNRFSQLENLR